MIWKCLLVDDEPLALNVLTKYIESVEQLEIVDTCSNAFQAMEVLQNKRVDIMFLDIQMPKLIGTSFVRTLQQSPKIIFTTAHKEFAAEAFDLDVVDYLLKPVSFERFLKAVNKIIQNKTIPEQEKVTTNDHAFLYFRADRKMVKVFMDEIIYVESLKDYVKIHRENEKPLIVKQSISTLEDMLPQTQFIRIHRSFIISLQKVTAFTNHDVEIGNIEIPIGKLYSYQMNKLSLSR